MKELPEFYSIEFMTRAKFLHKGANGEPFSHDEFFEKCSIYLLHDNFDGKFEMPSQKKCYLIFPNREEFSPLYVISPYNEGNKIIDKISDKGTQRGFYRKIYTLTEMPTDLSLSKLEKISYKNSRIEEHIWFDIYEEMQTYSNVNK